VTNALSSSVSRARCSAASIAPVVIGSSSRIGSSGRA
jgi:hypothetical protein